MSCGVGIEKPIVRVREASDGVEKSIDEVRNAIDGVGEAIDAVTEAIDDIHEAIDRVDKAINDANAHHRWPMHVIRHLFFRCRWTEMIKGDGLSRLE